MTYEEVVAAFAGRVRVYRRASFAKADCLLCRRRQKVEIKEGAQGVVLVRCHAGCETGNVLAAVGLGWPDLFPESAYEVREAVRLPEQAVLAQCRREGRWTIVTHDFGGDTERALAVELVEHLLPARAAAGLNYHWYVFPLTVGFVQRFGKKLGHAISEHCAERLIAIMEKLLGPPRWFKSRRGHWMRVFALPAPLVRSWIERAGAARTGLSAEPGVSSADEVEIGRARELLERLERLPRPPPYLAVSRDDESIENARAAA